MVKSSAEQKPPNCLQKKTQEFKGVRMRKWGKWVSEVRVPNSTARIWLGSYDTPQQAARAYDCAVYCLRGCKAKFNFPDSLPEIPSASSLSPAQIQAVAAKFAREEIRQAPDKCSAFCAPDSVCFTGSLTILEEQEWMQLFESLLEDIERNPSLKFEDFPMTQNVGFLPLEEEQRGSFPADGKPEHKFESHVQ
ncbi:hypothetical protein SUGI_0127340 [Cryptomeria japonica]|uniref:ethylene-responsive transcription factor ERF018-like n=1 Tax=Cryptomeria japonica TaxID=3369 RepID=UPI002408A48E|nr:ethylene-responsive transcription factor ERF018-like [Cryptomeria japonica]GLJ10392.1 hypothetical protein SUGI_0127340 [Cryptomeria japonica]